MENYQKTSAVIFIGFKTTAADGYEKLMPEFQAPKSVTKEETRLKKIAEKEEEFNAEAKNYVHTGSISEIITVEPGGGYRTFTDTTEFVKTFQREHGSRYDGEGQPVAGPVRFVGPNIRTFLKILWAQQARSPYPEQLPPSVLQTTHVDIYDVVLPSGFKSSLDVHKVISEVYHISKENDPLLGANLSAVIALDYNLFPQFKFDIAALFPESEEAMC